MSKAAEQPTSQTINIAGLTLHYLDWGGSGTPIILIHGLASTVHMVCQPALGHNESHANCPCHLVIDPN